MKRIALFVAAALMLLGCNAQSKQENTNTIKHSNNQEMNKIVIFFSHAGDNYSVGNIEVGNTKIVADYISEITGADQFEIVTHKYDTVFIGGPVWWGSGLASCASDVRKAFPKASVTGEFSIYGHEVRGGKAKVERWLKGIGF